MVSPVERYTQVKYLLGTPFNKVHFEKRIAAKIKIASNKRIMATGFFLKKSTRKIRPLKNRNVMLMIDPNANKLVKSSLALNKNKSIIDFMKIFTVSNSSDRFPKSVYVFCTLD